MKKYKVHHSEEIQSAVHFDETQCNAGGLHKEELMGVGEDHAAGHGLQQG